MISKEQADIIGDQLLAEHAEHPMRMVLKSRNRSMATLPIIVCLPGLLRAQGLVVRLTMGALLLAWIVMLALQWRRPLLAVDAQSLDYYGWRWRKRSRFASADVVRIELVKWNSLSTYALRVVDRCGRRGTWMLDITAVDALKLRRVLRHLFQQRLIESPA